jgi:hypothetical protein
MPFGLIMQEAVIMAAVIEFPVKVREETAW